ncbi:MAG TPA: hypothetical protein VIJ38_15070 [Acidobacteriaceae bacterium]
MCVASRCAAVFFATLLLAPGALPLAAQTSQPDALQALRAAVAAEMQASHTDHSIWTYRDQDDTPDKKAIYIAVETHEGTLRRMIKLNGHPLSPGQTEAETARINKYVHDRTAQAKARKNSAHDDAQAAEMLKMLPDAFIWSTQGETADQITLHFQPNPNFDPPDMQSRVMGGMSGEMVIARDGNRIQSLQGHLTHTISIGFGIIAKLDEGGAFDVERRPVGDGRWQITETHVHIGGHALLFKSIGEQEDDVKTDWKASHDDTLEEALHTLDALVVEP